MDKYSKEKSLAAWEANAEFWDSQMGDLSNRFHREAVRPKVTELLKPKADDYILDIACGNGNYSAYLADLGAKVLAFDYSPKMIALAEKRQAKHLDKISFCVADAADDVSLRALRPAKSFDKAVSNMAVMDIFDIAPLFKYVYTALKPGGIFVFATQHPCFVTLTDKYITPHAYFDIAIAGQPEKQCYYHRSIQDIFNLCFDCGFVINGFLRSATARKKRRTLSLSGSANCLKNKRCRNINCSSVFSVFYFSVTTISDTDLILSGYVSMTSPSKEMRTVSPISYSGKSPSVSLTDTSTSLPFEMPLFPPSVTFTSTVLLLTPVTSPVKYAPPSSLGVAFSSPHPAKLTAIAHSTMTAAAFNQRVIFRPSVTY